MKNEMKTITEVTENYPVSTRMLRYYEQIGLLKSVKKEGYAYRAYEESSLVRLEQILVLRKLRIPMKEIQRILQSDESRIALAVFQEKMKELSSEITALSVIHNILQHLVDQLKLHAEVRLNPGLWTDKALLQIVDALPLSKSNLKEDLSMSDFNKADDRLSKLKDVRIVYLPPSSVASIHIIGRSPEYETGMEMQKFMLDTRLAQLKPDLRHYGFNHPNGVQPDGADHGYERWVTVPDDLEVSAPFVKKQFAGGLYAAHMIPMGSFEEWGWLNRLVNDHEEYEPNWGDPDCMYGSMEECLNYINLYHLSNEEIDKVVQLDLLLPIKSKLNQ